MQVCSNCQAENEEGVRYCERCGRALGRPPRRTRVALPLILAVVVLALAGAGLAALTLAGDGTAVDMSAGGPVTAPAPSPSPSPAATGPVELTESFGRFLYGSRVNYWVVELSRDDECVINGFRSQGIGRLRGAYKSDCSDWERAGFDIYFFRVIVKNKSEERITFERSDLSLRDRKGKVHRPIDVREHTLFPEEFVPNKSRIPPGGELEGWLIFDGKGDYLPDSLTYREGDEILTQTFDGRVTRL